MIKIRKKTISFLLILFLFVSMVGAINVDTSYAATKKIHLKKTTISLVAGKTYQQKLIDKNGKTIKATNVKWKSSKLSVAKISNKGKVTAVTAGTAKMTARYKGKTYKFVVKVTKPFASNVKPTITKMVPIENYIALNCKKIKNAKRYDFYVSVNNGSYECIDQSDYEGTFFRNVKAGKTYSFKVRAVCGKYKTAFSPIKTVKFQSNTYIKASPSEISLGIGETKSVTITSGQGYGMSYIRNNTNVSCVWGDWIDDTSCIIDITGDRAGQSVVTIVDSADNKVKAMITVNITAPKKDIGTLVEYLKENEEIEVKDSNSNGNRVTTISMSSDMKSIMFNNGIIIKSGNNSSISQQAFAIDVDFDKYTDKPYFYYRWDFFPNGDTSITDYSYRMNSYVDARVYKPGDAIDWTITKESSAMSAEELGLKEGADADFKKAVGYWNSALNDKLGMTLYDLGFDNCN